MGSLAPRSGYSQHSPKLAFNSPVFVEKTRFQWSYETAVKTAGAFGGTKGCVQTRP